VSWPACSAGCRAEPTAHCDITHGLLQRRRAFDAYVATLPVAFELVHLDERNDDVAAVSDGGTPCVVARTDACLVVLLEPDELESCQGDPAEFRGAIDRAVETRGLHWPT
jgi:hypothetical protein